MSDLITKKSNHKIYFPVRADRIGLIPHDTNVAKLNACGISIINVTLGMTMSTSSALYHIYLISL